MTDQPSPATGLIPGVLTFAAAQACERALLDGMRDERGGTCRALVWRTDKAIIVPRGLPSRDYFAAASAAVEALGYPVHERDTGGDLTPQDPGVVNISLAFRLDGSDAAIKDAYQRLTDPVIAFLSQAYGIEARVASIPGAFCDGAFNIAVGAKKLAGTAQKWKLLGGEGSARRVAVLGHVALMVSNDLPPAIDALNAFYAASGSDRRIIQGRHVTLDEHLGRAVSADSAARALSAFLADRGM
ncbi:MAG: hypothetical protein ABL907_23040 [Hyphomicrobium sp.]